MLQESCWVSQMPSNLKAAVAPRALHSTSQNANLLCHDELLVGSDDLTKSDLTDGFSSLIFLGILRGFVAKNVFEAHQIQESGTKELTGGIPRKRSFCRKLWFVWTVLDRTEVLRGFLTSFLRQAATTTGVQLCLCFYIFYLTRLLHPLWKSSPMQKPDVGEPTQSQLSPLRLAKASPTCAPQRTKRERQKCGYSYRSKACTYKEDTLYLKKENDCKRKYEPKNWWSCGSGVTIFNTPPGNRFLSRSKGWADTKPPGFNGRPSEGKPQMQLWLLR